MCGAERRADEKVCEIQAMDDTDADEVSTEDSGVLTPNHPVEESTRHRLKWVTQAREYRLPSKIGTLWDEETLELKPLNPPPIHTFSSTPKHGRSILLGFGTLLTLLTHQILTIQVDKYKVSCWRDGSNCALTTKPPALPLWHLTPPSLRRIRHLPRKHHANHQSSRTRERSLTFGSSARYQEAAKARE